MANHASNSFFKCCFFDECFKDEPKGIRGFIVPFLNRFTHEDCISLQCLVMQTRPRSIILRYLMLICQYERSAYCKYKNHWNGHSTCNNIALNRKASSISRAVKIEGLIVLWLIFNLSRLYPKIKLFNFIRLHTAPNCKQTRENEK